MTKDEALTMCLEYIETNKHERKYVRHAIKAALEQAEPCIGKDPRCPCQDGDACHYKDCGGTKAWPVPQAEPVSCRFCHNARGCWTWQCYNCGEIDDVQQPAAQPVQEPVAWGWRYDSCGHAVVNRLVATETSEPTLFLKNVFARGPFPLYAAPQPVQEPDCQATGKCVRSGLYVAAQPVQEDSCFCHDGVSLQIVSGGAAPEGYLGKVTLLIDGKYVDYVKAQPVQPVQEPLDDWDIDAIRHNIGVDIDSLWARKFARAIEAAHGIKEKT